VTRPDGDDRCGIEIAHVRDDRFERMGIDAIGLSLRSQEEFYR
jgi:hypothetical protein